MTGFGGTTGQVAAPITIRGQDWRGGRSAGKSSHPACGMAQGSVCHSVPFQ